MNKVERDLFLIVLVFILVAVVHSVLGCQPAPEDYVQVNQEVYMTNQNTCPTPTKDEILIYNYGRHGHPHRR